MTSLDTLLRLPYPHEVHGFIKENPRRAGEILGHVLVRILEPGAYHQWATYLVNGNGGCSAGTYLHDEPDARLSLMTRAGWYPFAKQGAALITP